MTPTRSARTAGLLVLTLATIALSAAACAIEPRTADAAPVAKQHPVATTTDTGVRLPGSNAASVVGLLVVSRDSAAVLVLVNDSLALDSLVGRQLQRHAVPLSALARSHAVALIITADSLTSDRHAPDSVNTNDDRTWLMLPRAPRRATRYVSTVVPVARVIAPRGVVSIDSSTLARHYEHGGAR